MTADRSTLPLSNVAHLQDLNEAQGEVQVSLVSKEKGQGHEKPNGQDAFAVEEEGDSGVGLGLHQLADLQQKEVVSPGVIAV